METSKSLEIVLKQDKNGKLENETRGHLYDSLELIEVIESLINMFHNCPQSREHTLCYFPQLIKLVENPSQRLKDDCEIINNYGACYVDNFSEQDAEVWMDNPGENLCDLPLESQRIVLLDRNRAEQLLSNGEATLQRLKLVKDQEWYEEVVLLNV